MEPKIKTKAHRKILLILILIISVAGALACGCTGLFASDTIEAPSRFKALEENMQITLSWIKDSNSDKVLIRYDTDTYPASITDGKLVYEGSETSYVHTGLDYGETYYYSIWSAKLKDAEWIYSSDYISSSATPCWSGLDGEEIHEFVEIGSARMIGADGDYIELINNPESHNPTWEELKQFLWQDETDQQLYDYSSFVCADFAEMLHNNAENAGIRAAFVSIDFYSSSAGHAINAFCTTDNGMVYIDSTGTMEGNLNADKTVDLIIGVDYIPVSIFDNPGYEPIWENMGQVTEVWMQW